MHDEALLQEIIVAEPFRFKPSTREWGHAWEVIAGRLNSHQKKRDGWSVRVRVGGGFQGGVGGWSL